MRFELCFDYFNGEFTKVLIVFDNWFVFIVLKSDSICVVDSIFFQICNTEYRFINLEKADYKSFVDFLQKRGVKLAGISLVKYVFVWKMFCF